MTEYETKIENGQQDESKENKEKLSTCKTLKVPMQFQDDNDLLQVVLS